MTTLALPMGYRPVAGDRGLGPVARTRRSRLRPPCVPSGEETPHEIGTRLLAGCLAGDARARSDFALQYRGLVRFAVEKVLRQAGSSALREDLDDVCQSALGALFDRDCHKLRLYDGRHGASLATFLRVCATRHALDHLRQHRRRPVVVDDDPAGGSSSQLDEAIDPAAGPEAITETRERIARLTAAIAQLTPRERIFVRLHFVEELDLAPVAKMLGVTENAAYVLKSRLRKKLRELTEAARGTDVRAG